MQEKKFLIGKLPQNIFAVDIVDEREMNRERRRRLPYTEMERAMAREAQRVHPNNPELRLTWVQRHRFFLNMNEDIRQVYIDRTRGRRRI